MRWRAFTVLCALLVAGPAWALDPDVKCGAAKIKEAVKYAFCLGKVESKAIKKNEVPDTSKCDTKYGEKWQKAETKAEGSCPSSGDQAAIAAQVQQFVGDLVAALEPSGVSCAAGAVEVGGACWYMGGFGDSCATVCGNAGLAYDPATDSYAGDNGTLLQCYAVLDALGETAPPLVDGGDFICTTVLVGGFGCHVTSGGFRSRCTDPSTNAFDSDPLVKRACACQ